MAMLPDEIWTQILEMGTTSGRLSYRDLCALAIACRRLNRLSRDPSLWTTLLYLDFPSPLDSAATSPKSLYRVRFEWGKARRAAAASRVVFFAESQVSVSRKRLEELESSLVREGKRLKAAIAELANAERVRTACVALSVWQPEVAHGKQKQMVEQYSVPIESRLSALKMEVKVCKQEIAMFNKAYNVEKKKLDEYKEVLSSLKYHPLHSYSKLTISSSNKQKKSQEVIMSAANYGNDLVNLKG